jgi:ArsR family transcriptional regulator
MEQLDLSKIFKALSNEQRLAIFKYLHEWEKTSNLSDDKKECCGIERAFTKACEHINLSRSTISHHLKELQNAGLISCTRNGQVVTCKINEDAVRLIKAFLD